MHESYEIVGTEMPIYEELQKNHFTRSEILALEEQIEDYRAVGFVQKRKFDRPMYETCYERKYL